MIDRITPMLVGLLVGLAGVTSASGQTQVTVKNDGLPDNLSGWSGTLGLLGAFNFNEEQNVFLTAPCDGRIVAIDILWGSMNGFAGTTVEQVLGLYEVGACDPITGDLNRSTTPLTQPGFGDVVLIGPALTASPNVATPNRFQFLDENSTIAMNVPVTSGQQFAVRFVWGDDYCNDFCSPGCQQCLTYSGPFIPHDAMGCDDCKNNVFGPPFGKDTCFLGSSGNIVIRAIVECDSGDGACCLPDGSCAEMSNTVCESLQGVFQGVGTTCATTNCVVPTGACCVAGVCTDGLDKQFCEVLAEGTWLGPNTVCDAQSCILPTRACCLPAPDKSCIETDQADCEAQGGTYYTWASDCDQLSGGGVDCDPVGACCIDEMCWPQQLTEGDCVMFGGAWKGAGTNCAVVPDLCIPTGACCNPATLGCLAPTFEDDCLSLTGFFWLGADTDCANDGPPDSACAAAAPCDGDCTGPQGVPDGEVGISDFLAILASWGTIGACDWAPNGGNAQVGVEDFLFVLQEWGPCP